MTRTKLLIAVGLLVAVVVTVGVVLVMSKRPSDCDTVRSMVTYNNQFNERVEATTADGVQTEPAELRDWAAQLGHLAEQIRDPALAEQAAKVASLAEETVPLFERFLAAPTADLEASTPPQYLVDYSRIGHQFDSTLATLDERCPA